MSGLVVIAAAATRPASDAIFIIWNYRLTDSEENWLPEVRNEVLAVQKCAAQQQQQLCGVCYFLGSY